RAIWIRSRCPHGKGRRRQSPGVRRMKCTRIQEVPMRVTVLLLASVAASQAFAAPAPTRKQAEPLPRAVVAAWVRAGAEVGWMGPVRGCGHSAYCTNRWEYLDAARSVPAFHFKEWRKGEIAKLPAPARPFGIDLGENQATDAALKELAGFKNLSA